MTRTILAALSAALACTIFVQHYQLEHQLGAERARTAASALVASNALAAADSTRTIAALTSDSMRVVEKRVLQVTQHGDATDHALHRERRAVFAMSATVDSLRRTSVGAVTVTSTDDVRHASFDIRREPYTVAAQVDIPQPPDSARLDLHVSLDTIDVAARLMCGSADASGVRTASIVAATPAWAAVRFGRVEQSPDVCTTPASHPRGHHLSIKPLTVGVGRAVLWGGGSGWALFLGGVVIWV